MRRTSSYCVIILVALSLAACAAPSLPTATDVPTRPAQTDITSPTDSAVPIDTPQVVQPATPTSAPTAGGESSTIVVMAPTLGLSLRLPQGWQPVGQEAFWSPNGDAAEGVGAARVALEPPMEAEAVLLPGPSQVLDSQPATTPWGAGRRVTIEVYGEAQEGAGQGPVLSVETHVLVTRSTDGTREVLDIYARAGDKESLDALAEALNMAVETAAWGDGQPAAEWGSMQERTVEAIGLRFMLPARFQGMPSDLDGQYVYASPDLPGVQVGVLWCRLDPPTEAEAALLPTPSRVLDSQPVELGGGSGRMVTLELLGAAEEGQEAPVVGVERHLLVVRTDDQGRLGVSIYMRAPELDQLEASGDLLESVIASVSFGE